MSKKNEKCIHTKYTGNLNIKFGGIAGELAVFLCEDCYEYIITPWELWGA